MKKSCVFVLITTDNKNNQNNLANQLKKCKLTMVEVGETTTTKVKVRRVEITNPKVDSKDQILRSCNNNNRSSSSCNSKFSR